MSTGPDQRPPLESSRLAAHDIELIASTTSTNALLGDRVRTGAPGARAVIAEAQTAGRGRLARSWTTPPGAGLTFSVAVRPDVDAARWPWLPLVAGVAVVEVLCSAGFRAGLKWPNDVLLGDGGADGKVAGLLVERVEGVGGAEAVIGIGLNVTTTREELPVPTATSLALHAERTFDRTALAIDLIRGVRRAVNEWSAGADYVTRYRQHCLTLGRAVAVERPAAPPFAGTAIAVDADGCLVVEGTGADAGRRIVVSAGDVVHARHAG